MKDLVWMDRNSAEQLDRRLFRPLDTEDVVMASGRTEVDPDELANGWDPDWPEDVRRRVLADAPGWHLIKGTPQGIRLALAAIGARAVIDEWWQDGVDLPRGVARVTAYADRRLYDDAAFILERGTVRTVQSIVRAAMPVSRPVRVRMGVEGGAAQASGGRTLAHHRGAA